jgi:hypothetical protein
MQQKIGAASLPTTSYLHDLARHFTSGRSDPFERPALDDEMLIARLVET